MFIKMPFNSPPLSCDDTFSCSSSSTMPSAKLSFNINAFNGNTTNFNRASYPSPSPKASAPQHEPMTWVVKTPTAGLIRPL